MTNMQTDFGIGAQSRPVVFLLLGPGRSGKDTAAAELHRLSQLPRGSTSACFCNEVLHALRDDIAKRLGPNWRIVLGEWMASYMLSDGSGNRLYREMFKDGCRIFTGIRRLTELWEFWTWLEGRANVIVWWVDASRRDLPPDLSMKLDKRTLRALGVPYTVIDNNAGVEELKAEVQRAWKEFQAQ